MFCQKCGNPINDNNRYCNNCGAEVPMLEASASIQPGMSKFQTIPDRLMPTLNTRSLSRRMNII
ncbi:MAG: zinc ribbon domain-containing protein, partial [Ignavibacteriales bacterium]